MKNMTAQDAVEHEDYCELLERFRAWCAAGGRTFQEGMRFAIAGAMGETPTVATLGGRPARSAAEVAKRAAGRAARSASLMRLCECGCGVRIERLDQRGRERRFVVGHARRSTPGVRQMPEPQCRGS